VNKILSSKLPHLLATLAFVALVSFSFLAPLPEAAAQTRTNNFDITKGLVGEENIGCSGFDCQLCHVVRAVDNLISFMFYLATVIAVLLFIYAGAKMMMAGGDPGAFKKAREIFWNVIIGVVIMLCAYVFIDTILKTVLSPEARQYGPWNEVQCVTLPTGGTSTGTGPGTVIPVTGDEATVRAALRGIPINKGPCPAGASYGNVAGGCTNVAGLPQNAIEGVINLNNACGGCVTITGGTEGGHASHGPGNPMVDISLSSGVDNYVQQSGGQIVSYRGNSRDPVYKVGNDLYVRESNHWHIEFGRARN